MCNAAKQFVLDSDLPLGRKFVAYRVAETVNTLNDHDFWMDPATLADELGIVDGTVRKYLGGMVDDGLMEVLEQGGGKFNRTRYRFTACAEIHASSEATQTAPPGAVTADDTAPPIHDTAPPGAVTATIPRPLARFIENSKTPSENKTTNPLLSCVATQRIDDDLERTIDHDLCDYLADAIATSTGAKLRSDTKAWLTPMRRLRERGPAQLAKPEPVTPERIRRGITWALDDDFWSQQIRSPAALRKHWEKLRAAAAKPRAASGPGYQLEDQRRAAGKILDDAMTNGTKSLADVVDEIDKIETNTNREAVTI